MPTGSRREEQEEKDKDRKRIVVHGGVWGLLGTESRENWVKTVVPGEGREGPQGGLEGYRSSVTKAGGRGLRDEHLNPAGANLPLPLLPYCPWSQEGGAGGAGGQVRS